MSLAMPATAPETLAEPLPETLPAAAADDRAEAGRQAGRTAGRTAARGAGLARWGVFAAFLAAAGLPIYMHAPKVFAESQGLTLASLGAVLFGLRLFDLFQDPALGALAARLGPRGRALGVAIAAVSMGLAMLGLFAVTPPIAPLWWFALCLATLFTGWSFLTIAFYATGVSRAETLGAKGHLRLSGWREAGGLIGLCAAAIAPTALGFTGAPYAGFAIAFCVLGLWALWGMRDEWSAAIRPPSGFGGLLRDPGAQGLLALVAVNTAPLAVSSTLFLFYVETVLAAPGWEGPLLILFFIAAAAATPLWARGARRWGARPVLLAAMALAVAAFSWALLLGPGDVAPFALICVLTGAALGADMVILPALFARRMAQVAPGGTEGFSLWSFASKATLALAAASLLPALGMAGFVPGADSQPDTAVLWLGLLYAGLPVLLKLVAAGLLLRLEIDDDKE